MAKVSRPAVGCRDGTRPGPAIQGSDGSRVRGKPGPASLVTCCEPCYCGLAVGAGAGAGAGAGGGLGCVEPLDHVGRQVERRVGEHDARIALAEEDLDALFGHDLLDDRIQLALEGVLQVGLQLLHFFLRILLRALQVLLLAVDAALQLGPGALVEHGALRLELLLIGQQPLVQVVELGDLLLVQRLHPGRRHLALGGLGGDALDVEISQLGAFREGTSHRCGRRRRGRWRRGRRLLRARHTRRGDQREPEHKTKDKRLHAEIPFRR